MSAVASTRSASNSVANPASKPGTRATAESMAAKQRDISVSEFFAKNRHLLGFDSPRKALLTTVKEAVDNSLDACEEAGILPSIAVVIEDLQPERTSATKSSRYRITVVDNGPGIVRKQVENVFGRLLYGSKFHRLKMSRGQQGIGISAAGMYGLITTGRPMLIQTRPKASAPAHHIELAMNTKTNRAEVTVDEETEDFPLQRLRELPQVRDVDVGGGFLSPEEFPTGTSVTVELEGKYQRGRGSVDEFLELTAIANPHAKLVLVRPTRTTEDEKDEDLLLKGRGKRGKPEAGEAPVPPEAGAASPSGGASTSTAGTGATPAMTEDFGPVVIFPRGVESLPPETKEIQPHPKGVELGILLQMMKDFEATERTGTLYGFLQEKFSRVSAPTASEFCQKIGVTSRTKVADIEPRQAEALYQAFMEAKLPPPPTDCLAPIGVRQLLSGMLKGVRAEFYAASTREAEVYRGRPFLIEAAVAFGGELPAQEPARVIRFANRVPLLYQQSACSSFKAVTDTNWRNYDLDQPRGSVPTGPLVVMLHMASVWVPFTSESKEAIADYEEIRKEMKLALMECGRKLGAYLKKRARMRREGERRDVFQKYIGEIAKAVNAINGTDAKRLYDALLQQAMNRTAVADQVLDEDGRVVDEGDPGDQDGVIIIEANKPQPPQGPGGQGGSRGAPASGGASGGGGTTVGATRAAPSAKVAKAAKGSGGAKGARSSANPDRSAAAHLAVAAMAKDDDDQPTLLPRERAGPAAPKAAQPAPAPVTTPSSSPASPMADKAAARAAKPTLRVDPATGKLTPAPKTGRGRDDGAAGQGLFGR